MNFIINRFVGAVIMLCACAVTAGELTSGTLTKFNGALGVSKIENSGKTVYRFDGGKGGWSGSLHPAIQFKGKDLSGSWIVSAFLKLESAGSPGTAFCMGMYSYPKKKDIFKRMIQTAELSTDTFKQIVIGSTDDLTAELWMGGPARKGAAPVLVEKITFTKAGKGEIPEEFAGKKVIQIQKIRVDQKRAGEVADSAASDGVAWRFPGKFDSWSMSFSPSESPEELAAGNPWNVVFFMRSEGPASLGAVFEAGLFNQTKKEHVLRKKFNMEYMKGTEYQMIEFGTVELAQNMYFWGGALAKKEVDAVYIDRILLISEKK